MKRSKRYILIQDDVLYKRVTIRARGKGVLVRDQEVGKDIGIKRQFLVTEGQFLISKIDARNGAMGLALADVDQAIITADFLAFDIDDSIIDPYFFWLLSTTDQFISFCQSCSSGTTNRQRLDERLFLNLKIPLPTTDLQLALVRDYQIALKKVEFYEAEVKQLENKTKNYLDSFFGIMLSNLEQRKGLFLAEYKDIDRWGLDFAGYRSKWEVQPKYPIKRISELCKVSSGGTPNRSIKSYYENGNIPWVKTTEVTNDIITNTEECLTETGLANSSAKLYPPGSLIIAMYGQGATRGRTAKLGIEASTNQACAVLFNIKSEIIMTDYFWITLMHEYDRLREMASGNNQPNLNAGMLLGYKIQVADMANQQKVIDYYFAQKTQIKDLQSAINILRKKALTDFEMSIFIKQ